jgi:Uma2 family endonuclease
LVIGKERLDLTLDPPPDLAIEIDITSKTQQAAYLALKVPELWIYDRGKLNIYLWQSGQYILSKNSFNFPDIPITELIPQFMERAKVVGVSQMLLEFEEYIKALMDSQSVIS